MPSVSIYDWRIERISYQIIDLSQEFEVSVVEGGFSGKVTLWCHRTDLHRFIEQLRECEKTRRGEAKLEAMSPQEFSLRIFNSHSKGDFAVSYRISKSLFNMSNCLIEGEFELDPSFLMQILRDFEELVAIP
ncbi:MAG TPA: hypothetical protein VGB45_05680 [Abditibacterium sp.]|jgi:hypothetical protein